MLAGVVNLKLSDARLGVGGADRISNMQNLQNLDLSDFDHESIFSIDFGAIKNTLKSLNMPWEKLSLKQITAIKRPDR